MLTNDAFDGNVDGLYPLPTYGEAIAHLPIDAQSYSTIANVIDLARQTALQQAGKGVKADRARCGYALAAKSGPTSGTSTGRGTTTGGGGTTTGRGGTTTGRGTTTGGDSSGSKGPFPDVIHKFGPNNADSFPLALIVIAAIAGLLVLGGGVGYVVRRRQRERGQAELEAGPGSTPSDDDDPTSPPALGP